MSKRMTAQVFDSYLLQNRNWKKHCNSREALGEYLLGKMCISMRTSTQ